MTRMEEYSALMQELEVTPERLNFTVAHAKARTRRQKVQRAIGAPLLSLSAACFAFVLLVNVSMPFAMACARVPFFKELAQAVCFNPSLYAAVKNEWVQPIGQSSADNGYTMTVEYLIVDRKQLNVFYTLEGGKESDPGDCCMLRPVFLDEQGEKLTVSVLTESVHANGEMGLITADFTSAEGTMPGRLRMECGLNLCWDDSAAEERNEGAAAFAFDLSFDPKFTAEATVVDVNRRLELDGQRILLKNVEIYPTHIRVNLEDYPDNTAWLRDLELYVQNEKGVRFGSVKNGIRATGSPDSPFTAGFRLESSFFAGSRRLTLNITGASWLEKEKRWTQVDLTTGEAGYLPDQAIFRGADRTEEELTMVFHVPVSADGRGGWELFSSWRAPDGSTGYFDEVGWSGAAGEREYAVSHVKADNYAWDTIELELDHSKTTEYAEPVTIDLF